MKSNLQFVFDKITLDKVTQPGATWQDISRPDLNALAQAIALRDRGVAIGGEEMARLSGALEAARSADPASMRAIRKSLGSAPDQ